jgi:hypothetical protein
MEGTMRGRYKERENRATGRRINMERKREKEIEKKVRAERVENRACLMSIRSIRTDECQKNNYGKSDRNIIQL